MAAGEKWMVRTVCNQWRRHEAQPHPNLSWKKTISLTRMTTLPAPRSIKVWIKVRQIQSLSWPARPPHLNRIENVIRRKMDGHKHIKQSYAACPSAWGSIVTQHRREGALGDAYMLWLKIKTIPPYWLTSEHLWSQTLTLHYEHELVLCRI